MSLRRSHSGNARPRAGVSRLADAKRVNQTVKQAVKHGLARVLSKAGVCSRSQAAQWIADGRVCVDGRCIRDPQFAIHKDARPQITVDGEHIDTPSPRYLMLNKPRGLVTTADDEQGRDTVYRCFDGAGLGWIAPVGRLDKASEGLLLFSNDPAWAAAITDPASGPDKTYHVQVDGVPDDQQLLAMQQGVTDAGEFLCAQSAVLLRSGGKTAWLEVVLAEGRNRHIRRLLAVLDLPVKRLLRVGIGSLQLGSLGKGQWRELSLDEVQKLGSVRLGAD